jgi:hypothetical protein
MKLFFNSYESSTSPLLYADYYYVREGTGYICGLQINPLSSGEGKPANPEKNHQKRL